MAALDAVELAGDNPKHGIEGAIDFLGGVAGGVASVYVGQPLDTVKVKMQTFPTMYRNAMSCFLTTLRREGVARGLYAGTVPSLWAQVSENAVLFMAYGFCQKGVMNLLGKTSVDQLSILQKATAGGGAAVFSSLVLCPTELIKCKQQAMKEMSMTGQLEGSLAQKAKHNHIGPWSLTKQIIRTEGFRGMFRGLVPTFAREVPGYFFFFGGYEISCLLMTPEGGSKDDLRPWQTAMCGGIGGATLWILVFPTDVVKSRVQVIAQTEQRSAFGLFLHILRYEGFLALYKGLGPTLLRTFPATGALFLAYENTTRLLNQMAKPDTSSAL